MCKSACERLQYCCCWRSATTTTTTTRWRCQPGLLPTHCAARDQRRDVALSEYTRTRLCVRQVSRRHFCVHTSRRGACDRRRRSGLARQQLCIRCAIVTSTVQAHTDDTVRHCGLRAPCGHVVRRAKRGVGIVTRDTHVVRLIQSRRCGWGLCFCDLRLRLLPRWGPCIGAMAPRWLFTKDTVKIAALLLLMMVVRLAAFARNDAHASGMWLDEERRLQCAAGGAVCGELQHHQRVRAASAGSRGQRRPAPAAAPAAACLGRNKNITPQRVFR